MVRVRDVFISPSGSKRLTLAVVGIMALIGMALILYATAIAPWAWSDSAAYISTARNIAAGRGIVLQDSSGTYSLLPLHAPLYPLILNLPLTLGMDVLQAAGWLNALLYGLTIFLTGWAVSRFTGSFWLSAGTAGLFLVSFEPLLAFTGLMAEGLFIFFALLSLVWVTLALREEDNSSRLLVAAGISAGLAILARYTGLSVLAAGCLAVWLFHKGSSGVKIKKALLFTVPGAVLAALWLIPVYFSTQTFGSRQIGEISNVSGRISSYFSGLFDVVGSWIPFFYRGNHILTPGTKLALGSLLLFVILVAAVIRVRKNETAIDENGLLTWIRVLILFTAAYLALHLTTFLIAAEQPDVNGRLLLPIFYSSVLLAAAITAFISQSVSKSWLGGLVFSALALMTLWYFHSKVQWHFYEMHHYGQGFTSNRWNENPIFDQVSALDDQPSLYSNDPALVLFYTERLPKDLKINPSNHVYDLPSTSDAELVLFIGEARKDLSEGYPAFVDTLRAQYQVLYEDNEGMIFTTRQP